MRLLTRAEELLLLAVWNLQSEAYCLPIRAKLDEITGEKWSLGAIYMPLERLVKQGLLESYLSESTPERGGRHKRIYRITEPGKRELVRVKEVGATMWDGIADPTPDTP